MTTSRLRWLVWTWRVACASYLVGLVTMLPYASVIVWWTSLLFTPLLTVTLVATRSRRLATVGIPLIGAALLASVQLWYAVRTTNQVPQSAIYLTLWFIGVLGPLVLYPVVSRHVAGELKATTTDSRSG